MKVPNVQATNGTTRPWNVFSQPRSDTIWNWATMMTSVGTISVARKARKTSRLPGKRRKAKA